MHSEYTLDKSKMSYEVPVYLITTTYAKRYNDIKVTIEDSTIASNFKPSSSDYTITVTRQGITNSGYFKYVTHNIQENTLTLTLKYEYGTFEYNANNQIDLTNIEKDDNGFYGTLKNVLLGNSTNSASIKSITNVQTSAYDKTLISRNKTESPVIATFDFSDCGLNKYYPSSTDSSLINYPSISFSITDGENNTYAA